MAEYIVMPKLGFDMREGMLNNWLKQVGDPIHKGEVVAEIESDKATLELEAQVAGTLLVILETAGTVVPIGANLAVVGTPGEDISALTGGLALPKPASGPATPPPAGKSAPVEPVTAVSLDTAFPDGRRATPVARRLAREQGISLLQVSGSGPDGRIRKADVEAYLSRPPAPVAPPVAAAMPTPPPSLTATVVDASRLRQAIARRMVESKSSVPHFYVTTAIDMQAALNLRQQINAVLPEEQKVSINDLIVKAVALALRDFPNLNASFAGEKIIQHQAINVGTAVAVAGGLLTVVQKNTDTATLSKVAADNKAMIGRARLGKIKPDDVSGGTFTISNLGVYDVDNFIAIINPPEAAILAVGSVKAVPVVVDGALAVGQRLKVTLSADHRVSDGAEAARFLQQVKGVLERPLRLLL